MNRVTPVLALFAILPALALQAMPAQAQLARTFVSSFGNDANDCNRLTPCRTFQRAHDNTLALGEITVLDPGGYGAVTIGKSISIINDGVGEAGALVSGGGTGITIAAAVTDNVSLRGLTIKGIGFGGGNGIVVTHVESLSVENCVIRSLTTSGGVGGYAIGFVPDGTADRTLVVSNTLIADNDQTAVHVAPLGSGFVNVTLNRVQMYNNLVRGLYVDGAFGAGGHINATALDSVAVHNNAGFYAHSTAGHYAVSMMVIRSAATNNNVGVTADGGILASARVGQTVLSRNVGTWTQAGGATVQSFGDNYVALNNDGDPAAPGGLIAPK
jgi:hypothetical protein